MWFWAHVCDPNTFLMTFWMRLKDFLCKTYIIPLSYLGDLTEMNVPVGIL